MEPKFDDCKKIGNVFWSAYLSDKIFCDHDIWVTNSMLQIDSMIIWEDISCDHDFWVPKSFVIIISECQNLLWSWFLSAKIFYDHRICVSELIKVFLIFLIVFWVDGNVDLCWDKEKSTWTARASEIQTCQKAANKSSSKLQPEVWKAE